MPRRHQRFLANENEVAAKVIDGEVIIINLSNGMYYSMDKVGADVWLLIAAGHSIDEISSILSKRYDVDQETVASGIDPLADQLLEEQLIVANDAATAPEGEVELESVNGAVYETPAFNKYSDMGDVLALDPPLPQLEEEPWSGEETKA
jgi:hypothetical protein